MKHFENVKTSSFIDDNVLGSVSYCQSLKSLSLVGKRYLWREGGYKIDKSSLPLSLQKLELSNCEHVYLTPFDKKLAKLKLFPTLNKISFQYDSVAFPPAVDCILWMMNYPRTYSIKLYAPRPSVSIIIQDLHERLSKIAEKKDFFKRH